MKTAPDRERLIDLAELPATLRAAYEGDWDADERGRPVPPRPAATRPRRRRPSHPAPLAAVPPVDADDRPQPLPVAAAGRDTRAVRDVAELGARYLDHVETSYSRRAANASAARSPATPTALAAAYLRYAPGDPRLATARAGDPLVLTGPETGLVPAHLLAFLSHREHTNLRTRAANECAMARWADACPGRSGAPRVPGA